jgi:hypothetical protein
MSALKQLEGMLLKGKISRRQFLTQVSALGLAAAVSPALLSDEVLPAKPLLRALRHGHPRMRRPAGCGPAG